MKFLKTVQTFSCELFIIFPKFRKISSKLIKNFSKPLLIIPNITTILLQFFQLKYQNLLKTFQKMFRTSKLSAFCLHAVWPLWCGYHNLFLCVQFDSVQSWLCGRPHKCVLALYVLAILTHQNSWINFILYVKYKHFESEIHRSYEMLRIFQVSFEENFQKFWRNFMEISYKIF